MELGATGTIVVMICMMWDVNAATGRYLSTDFIVSDIKGNLMHCTARGNIAHNFLRLKEGAIYSVKNFSVQLNKEKFRVMRYANFMLKFDDRLYRSSTSSTLIVNDEKIPMLNGVELTKEMLPANNTTPKAGTLENFLMIDKVRTKKGWNYPSYGGEKCKKGNISQKVGQLWCDSCESLVEYLVIRLELEISDDTAEVVVVMFDETTTSLVKCSTGSIVCSEGRVVTPEIVEGTASSGMVAAKADSKAPVLGTLSTVPSVATPSKPKEVQDSDAEESFVTKSQPKGGDVGCSSDMRKRKRLGVSSLSLAEQGMNSGNNHDNRPSLSNILHTSDMIHSNIIIRRDGNIQSFCGLKLSDIGTPNIGLGTSLAPAKWGTYLKRKALVDTPNPPFP
ncbi:ATP-dependent DNA helicase PIF2 [Tanacetum coccineum]